MPDDKMTTILKAALQYRAEGRSVFPIIDKKPKVKWKELQSRLATEEELKEWFGRNPSLQIAMVMGRVSGGLWVMDADGFAAVDWMKENAPPTTVYARTKRGRHAYYLMPPGVEIRCTANAIPDLKKSTGHQIDVKGEGGYTVAPPSAFKGGEYRWEIDGLGWDGLTVWQPPSATVANPIASSGNLNIDLSNVRASLDYFQPVPDGERNDALARFVGKLIAQGRPLEDVLLSALGWNTGCTPPLSEERVRLTVESVAKTHIRNHGALQAQPIQIDVVPEIKRRPKQMDDIPGHVLKPGGIIEKVMDYIEKSTVANYHLFSMAAALVMVGTLVGQKVMTETGLRTNLYVFALAPSGTGKEAPLAVFPRLLQDAGASDDNLGPDHLASSAALLSRLESKPCQLMLLDEIGDLMGTLKNKRDVTKNDLPKVLKSLYSSTARGAIKAYANSSNNVNIGWHHLSFYATGVPGEFWTNLSVSDVTGGFIARSLLFSLDLLAPFPREDVDLNPPTALVESIRNLHLLERQHTGNMQTTPIPIKICKESAAKNFFVQWHRGYHELQNKHRHDPDGRSAIYARVAENAHKLALIHAVSLAEGIPPCVSMESVKFATSLMDWMVPIFVKNISTNICHNEQDALCKRVLTIIERKGAVSKRDIYRSLNGCTPQMAENAIKILEECGELSPAHIASKNGRVNSVWLKSPKGEDE